MTTSIRFWASAPCRADVQAAACRRGGDELDADGDGVGLVAVFGRGVAEADVLGDVLGWQHDGAATGGAADGERAVGVYFGDRPEFAVAYGVAVAGGELSVVATRGDDVADVGALASADADAGRHVELAGANASSLDSGVDGVDVIVGRGRDRGAAVAGSILEPDFGDAFEVALEGVGDDPTVGLVGLERPRVAIA